MDAAEKKPKTRVENKISFEIVPGVTSAIAVPAYAGIPLTHRGLTSTVAFVTGHEDPTKEKSDIDWQALTRIGTLVFLMGVKNIGKIVEELTRNGKRRKLRRPDSLGYNAAAGNHHRHIGLILSNWQRKRNFSPPAILVVGKVVDLTVTRLKWFEQKPLLDRGIVITRPEKQADELARLWSIEGAIPFISDN